MLKAKYMLLFFSLFLFLISSNQVYAYTMFSANSYFNDSIGTVPLGIVLYSPLYNNTFYQNATCSGLDNCLIVENDGLEQMNRLYIQQYDWYFTGLNPQWSNYSSLLEFNENNQQNNVKYLEIFLPKNQEGILVFNYLWNDSGIITTPTPSLRIDDITGTIATIYLNTTPSIWYNVSYILNATSNDRNLRIRLDWYWVNTTAGNLQIDKFKFYTYDIQEARTMWSSDINYERVKYCGEYSSNYTGTATNYWFNNITRGLSYLLAYGEDNYHCHVFGLGNTTIARRLINFDNTVLYVYRDPFYLLVDYFNDYVLLTRLSLTTAQVTVFKNQTSIYTPVFIYDGTPPTQINISNSTNGLVNSLSGYIRQTVNILPFSNYSTPSGSNWLYHENIYNPGMHSSGYYPFFISPVISCTPQSICDSATNFQYYQTSTCEYTNEEWCGECGCKSDLTGCNFPEKTGAWCDDYNLTLSCTHTNNIQPCYDVYTENPNPYNASKRGFTVYSEDCYSDIYNECPINYMCVQYFNPLTKQYEAKVQCYNGMNGSAIYYNETGGLFNGTEYTGNLTQCRNPTQYTNYMTCMNAGCNWCDNACQIAVCTPAPPTTIDIGSNPFNYIAMAFGSFFGMNNVSYLPTNQAIASLLISLFFGLGITVSLAIKIKTHNLDKIFALTFLGLLSAFTIGLGNAYLWAVYVVLIIMSAGIMTGYFKKIIGGH